MRRFCCFSFEDFKGNGGDLVVVEDTDNPDSSEQSSVFKDPKKKGNFVNTTPQSQRTQHLEPRTSIGSIQPSSISCPQLLIEKATDASDEAPPINSFRTESRNTLSVRHHSTRNGGSPRTNGGNGGILTKTYSFKRMISFRSSRRGEPRSLQLSFLGQIYRKRSFSSNSSPTGISAGSCNEDLGLDNA